MHSLKLLPVPSKDTIKSLEKVKKQLEKEIALLETKLQTLLEQWQPAQLKSVGSIKGIGKRATAMLIVFIAMIAMVNYMLNDFLGNITGLNGMIAQWTDGQYTGLTLQFILGYAMAPFVWLLGVAKSDMVYIGQLLGEKTILNEFVAYMSLGKMKEAGVLQDPKSVVIATYILSGFANFSSIGIQVGGIGALAPNKRGMLSELGMKALLGGTICSLLTATIVAMLT